MVHEVKNMIRDVGVQVSVEVPAYAIFPTCLDKALRVDLFSIPSSASRPIVGDVTIRDPHPPSVVLNPTDALETAREDKEHKYLKHCEDADFQLQVYAFDFFGRMSDDIISLINTLNKSENKSPRSRNDGKYNWTCSTFRKYWKQRLSCCLQRSLAIKELNLVNKTMKQQSTTPVLFNGKWLKRHFSIRTP
jgi:hypothetical protein